MVPPRSTSSKIILGQEASPPQTLPEYLQKAQDTINSLLKSYRKGDLNCEDTACLGEFLSPYELASIEELRKEMKNMKENHPDPDKEAHPKMYKRNFGSYAIRLMTLTNWLSSFAREGIQFMVGGDRVKYILRPGVLNIPAREISADDFSRLKRVEARANELL